MSCASDDISLAGWGLSLDVSVSGVVGYPSCLWRVCGSVDRLTGQISRLVGIAKKQSLSVDRLVVEVRGYS